MGLDPPVLDDRSYEELLAEAMNALPVHAEAWTDYNAHDPGITVIELLAWLSESYAYQLDQVTDAHRAKYLRLAGGQRRLSRPARGDLRLTPSATADGIDVPAGQPLVVDDGSGTPKWFRTDDPLTLTTATLAAVVTAGRRGLTDNTHANATDGMHYRAFDEAAVGDALYLGFDGDPFAVAATLTLTVDFHDDGFPALNTDADPVEFEPSVRLSWQYCTDPGRWREPRAWAALSVRDDRTRRLYRGGRLVLDRPDAWPDAPATDEAVAGGPSGLVWLRCVIERPGYEIPPQFDSVAPNVVTASHRRAVATERLRRATGEEDRLASTGDGPAFVFGDAPVLDAEILVDDENWAPVPDFDASGADDRHYVLDTEHGVVTFGDGLRGERPRPGASVVAEGVVYGGGVAGNVTADSDWQFDATDGERGLDEVAVSPRGPASGGRNRESVDAALARVRAGLSTPSRAVTLADYRTIALATPGLRIARAAAFRTNGDAPGVRVVVVPFVPRGTAEPSPSSGFLDAVRRHLDDHTLLCDRATVVAPSYIDVGVRTTVAIDDGHDPADRELAVADAIESFLDPLSGFEGDGWPFGRPLHRSELYERIDNVPGVDYVRGLSLSARGARGRDDSGNVLIDEAALFAVDDGEVSVTAVRTDGGR